MRIREKVAWRLRGPDWSYLHPSKREAIDVAFALTHGQSFADLGGVWHVDGGYSFYALHHHAEHGVLADEGVTPALLEQAESAPGLRIVQGDFTDRRNAQEVGAVDVLFHFDTLLHQHDWRNVLALYAEQTQAFAIVQPQAARGETVRLRDLSDERYLSFVSREEGVEAEVQRLMAEVGRDATAILQWAISDGDLIAELEHLGFRLRFFRDWGRFRNMPRFDRRAFVFTQD